MRALSNTAGWSFMAPPTERYPATTIPGMSAFTGPATVTVQEGGSVGIKRNSAGYRPQTAWVGNVDNNPYFN